MYRSCDPILKPFFKKECKTGKKCQNDDKNEQKIEEEGPVLSVGRGEKLPVSKGAGLTAKGREKYNRKTGSNLQAPVTGDVKPGSKAAKRRKAFCSRSISWKGERGLAARRRWKCWYKEVILCLIIFT